MSRGGWHAWGLKPDSLTCWGDNSDGHATPPLGVFAPPRGTFTQVSAGAGFTCALGSDASMACWGALAIAQTPAGSSASP